MTVKELQILCRALKAESRISQDHPRLLIVTLKSRKLLNMFLKYVEDQVLDEGVRRDRHGHYDVYLLGDA